MPRYFTPIRCIIVYVGVWLLFALIYLNVHRANPRSFYIPSNLVEDLATESLAELELLKEQQAKLAAQPTNREMTEAIEDLLKQIQGSSGVPTSAEFDANGGIKYKKGGLCFWARHRPQGAYTRIDVSLHRDERELGRIANPRLLRKETVVDWTYERMRLYLELRLKETPASGLAHLNSQIEAVNRNPGHALGFSEFLYFSTIVQATIGFGDMVPNTRMVRMLVTFQSVLATSLSVFIFSMVLGEAARKVTQNTENSQPEEEN